MSRVSRAFGALVVGMKAKIRKYISVWEKRGYQNGIPDEAPIEFDPTMVPSYRAICVAILKNDVALASLGFQRPQCDAYMALKKIEIDAR